MGTRFGDWAELAAAAEEAPPAPGIFQVRAKAGLLRYPRGRSAMLFYGAAPDLRAGVAVFRSEAVSHWEEPETALWIRWKPAREPEALLRAYLDLFRSRFGALPARNPAR
ncbi:MAG: hypothetical protein ACE5H3_02500 [Planctomycetota bacterium]